MTRPLLIEPTRDCVVCGKSARPQRRQQPCILAFNVTIYRRTRAGAQLATAKRVRVCEDCAVTTVASQGARLSPEATKIARALFDRIAECYSAMVEGRVKVRQSRNARKAA